MNYFTMKETRAFLESIGMPGGDMYDVHTVQTTIKVKGMKSEL